MHRNHKKAALPNVLNIVDSHKFSHFIILHAIPETLVKVADGKKIQCNRKYVV